MVAVGNLFPILVPEKVFRVSEDIQIAQENIYIIYLISGVFFTAAMVFRTLLIRKSSLHSFLSIQVDKESFLSKIKNNKIHSEYSEYSCSELKLLTLSDYYAIKINACSFCMTIFNMANLFLYIQDKSQNYLVISALITFGVIITLLPLPWKFRSESEQYLGAKETNFC
jgi:hypothetical protein